MSKINKTVKPMMHVEWDKGNINYVCHLRVTNGDLITDVIVNFDELCEAARNSGDTESLERFIIVDELKHQFEKPDGTFRSFYDSVKRLGLKNTKFGEILNLILALQDFTINN